MSPACHPPWHPPTHKEPRGDGGPRGVDAVSRGGRETRLNRERPHIRRFAPRGRSRFNVSARSEPFDHDAIRHGTLPPCSAASRVPELRSAAAPPLTPPARGVCWHLSMAWVGSHLRTDKQLIVAVAVLAGCPSGDSDASPSSEPSTVSGRAAAGHARGGHATRASRARPAYRSTRSGPQNLRER